MRIYFTSQAIKAFAVFIVVDIIFLILHILLKLDVLTDSMFSLTIDGTYSEFFQYAKEAGIVVLLVYLARKYGSRLYGAWGLLFFYFLLDDSLRVHERIGNLIADILPFEDFLSLRAQDWGELFGYALFGLILGLIILWAYMTTHDAEQIKLSRYIFYLVVILVFFGVGMDLVHSFLSDVPIVDSLLGLGEDWGEMITMSAIFALIIGEITRPKEAITSS